MDHTRKSHRELTEAERMQVQEAKELGDSFLAFLNTIPEGRAKSIAFTRVEEAVMWTVKGITG